MSAAKSGGVIALPKRAKAWVMPCAQPRFVAGVQDASARVAVGNAAPSPKPSRMRAAKSEAKPLTPPIRTVAADQSVPQMTSVQRAPRKSPSHPPAIWKKA